MIINPGSGTKLGQISGSGSKFDVFGSATLVLIMEGGVPVPVYSD